MLQPAAWSSQLHAPASLTVTTESHEARQSVTYARLDSRLRLVCRCVQTASLSVWGECDDSKAKPEHKYTHSLQTTTDKLSKHACTLPDFVKALPLHGMSPVLVTAFNLNFSLEVKLKPEVRLMLKLPECQCNYLKYPLAVESLLLRSRYLLTIP